MILQIPTLATCGPSCLPTRRWRRVTRSSFHLESPGRARSSFPRAARRRSAAETALSCAIGVAVHGPRARRCELSRQATFRCGASPQGRRQHRRRATFRGAWRPPRSRSRRIQLPPGRQAKQNRAARQAQCRDSKQAATGKRADLAHFRATFIHRLVRENSRGYNSCRRPASVARLSARCPVSRVEKARLTPDRPGLRRTGGKGALSVGAAPIGRGRKWPQKPKKCPRSKALRRW